MISPNKIIIAIIPGVPSGRDVLSGLRSGLIGIAENISALLNAVRFVVEEFTGIEPMMDTARKEVRRIITREGITENQKNAFKISLKFFL